MSDTQQNAKQASERFVIVDSKTGKVETNRLHFYRDCGFLKDQPSEEVESIGDREARLLGLKACQVCEKRQSGGPVVTALVEILEMARLHNRASYEMTDEQTAWFIQNELRARGFYVSQRAVKDTKDAKATPVATKETK